MCCGEMCQSVSERGHEYTMRACVLLCVVVAVCVVTNYGVDAAEACGRHGDPCESDSQCCTNIKCHRFAKRCQVQITPEELQAQRDKILKRRE